MNLSFCCLSNKEIVKCLRGPHVSQRSRGQHLSDAGFLRQITWNSVSKQGYFIYPKWFSCCNWKCCKPWLKQRVNYRWCCWVNHSIFFFRFPRIAWNLDKDLYKVMLSWKVLSHEVCIQFQTWGQLSWSLLPPLPMWDGAQTVGIHVRLQMAQWWGGHTFESVQWVFVDICSVQVRAFCWLG